LVYLLYHKGITTFIYLQEKMNLNGYKQKYGDEALKSVCEQVGSSWTYFLAVMRGVKFLSRCMALHIEQVTGGECAWEELIRRPTMVEFDKYLSSNRGRGPRESTSHRPSP
jgi:hypothetical protein